ncbi:hypothetical protein OJAV_G00129320 [Oryzias javanicus]|uniref:LIM zinc-binding domain-containing protein n=1 Tax=Oryzias javanicus TaxID=123683 RepID=A0A437CPN6_ORYJA|nr:hypothetical protein OJAV_G00129320 [Oryzias javanicus]
MRLMLLCCTWKDERMGEDEAGERLPVCAGCKQRIYDEQYLQALNSDWHSLCFRCCECSASLSHWYYEKDGQLFCKKDYWAKFGELCHGCSDPSPPGSSWQAYAHLSPNIYSRSLWTNRIGARPVTDPNPDGYFFSLPDHQ